MIIASGLSLQRDGHYQLPPVDVAVESGHTLAVTGPSGCGKSTLLGCLAGLVRPTTGAVHFDETDLWALSESQRSSFRRSRLGQVSQGGDLLEELTAEENVALPLLFNGIPRRTAFTSARELLAEVGCAHLADRRPTSLSGGESQRVALARACVGRGVAILADEPTASLDQKNANAVGQLLVALAGEHEVAVVIATHDPAIARLCDQQLSLVVEPVA